MNKKFLRGAMLVTALLSLYAFSPSELDPRLKQKLDQAVRTTFGLEAFDLVRVEVPEEVDKETPVRLGGDNLFRIEFGEKLLGYAYVGEAPSMKNVFDYVVLFDPDLGIRKSKVLIYREDYGRQIGSQRWLRQFIGRKAGERLQYGTDVDAISGATISAKSMTTAVNEVLHSLSVLETRELL